MVTSVAQSTVQSVATVSPLASMVMSPIQPTAVPHLASLAAVFKEMMDAAQVDGTITPTMDEIEAEYECRWAALDRPATPRPIHTPPRGPVLSEAAVQVAQAELQLATSKMAVLEARAEQSESEVSSLKTLMHSMMQTMQGMQSIMSSNMAKGPEPSCSSSPGSIVSMSSRDSSGGGSLSSTPYPLVQVLSLILSLKVSVKLEAFPPMGQGPVETMSKAPDYLTSLEEKLGRSSLSGLMILPPTRGGTKKGDSMYCCR